MLATTARWVSELCFGLTAILALVVPVRPLAQGRVTVPSDLDVYVARVMKAFEIPGIAVTIVKDGTVVLASGYGVRTLAEPARVDAQTLFGIASNTKAFTATALGLLVEEGRIEWDGPVARYLPWFQLWDPYVTRELTVRDLLVHRSGLGLGAGDLLLFPPSTYGRNEIARRLRFVQPATSFRSAYAYDNVLYLVAGELIEVVSGRTWEQFVAERIFRRVGMTGSTVRYGDATVARNSARPHAKIDGIVRQVDSYADVFASDNVNPAGGIYSSAEDMGKWVEVLLQEGRLTDGSRLFSQSTARQLTTMVTPMPIAEAAPELAPQQMNFNGYALGLNVHDYRGRRVVTHTGGNLGNVSKVTMIPELDLGVVVLTNQDSREAYDAITYYILDHYIGAKPTDWVDAYQRVRARQRTTFEESAKTLAATRDASSRPSLPLARYAGVYSDQWYGDIEIAHENERLVMRFTRTASLVGGLEHWQHDTFIARWRVRVLDADAFVTFALAPDGSIDHVKMRAVSPITDFSFDFQDLLLKPVKGAQR